MALKAYRQGNAKQEIFNDRTKLVRLQLTLNEPYVTGGYTIDLELAAGLDITYTMSSTFGGYQLEYDVINKKVIVFKGGFEVANGQDFYDAVTGLYATFVLECYSVVHFRDEVQFQNPIVLLGISPETVAKTLGGIGSTQFLRNDVDDAVGVDGAVTTTIKSGSAMKVDGVVYTGTNANRAIEIKPTEIVLAEGANLNVLGAVSSPILRTFTVTDGSSPDVSGGSEFNVDGSITPQINTFYGIAGVDGQFVTLHCVADGCTIIHNPLYLSLQNGENYVFRTGATIKFKLTDSVWIEQWRQNNDGSMQVGTGGITAGVGPGTIFVGVGGTINVVGQMTQGIGSQFGSSATPSVAGETFFALDGAVTPSLTNFTGGSEGQVLAIACIGAGNTITPSANIQTQGGVPITPGAGDQITFKMVSGVWVEQPRGNTSTGEVGALKVIGPVVQPTPTPVTANGQDISKANILTLDVGTPTPIHSFGTAVDGTRMTLNFASAITLEHLSSTPAPGIPKISLAGGIDYSATPNSTTVLVYDLATNTWIEDPSQRYTAV